MTTTPLADLGNSQPEIIDPQKIQAMLSAVTANIAQEIAHYLPVTSCNCVEERKLAWTAINTAIFIAEAIAASGAVDRDKFLTACGISN